jgi:hypothetical protein
VLCTSTIHISARKAREATTLPDDWAPSQADEAHGKQRFSREQISSMGEDMRLWAGANAHRSITRKANWSTAFKNWMRREANGGFRSNYSARPYEKGYAEIADEIRKGNEHEEYLDWLRADEWTRH